MRKYTGVLLAGLLLAASGCGSDSGEEQAKAKPTATKTAEPETFTVGGTISVVGEGDPDLPGDCGEYMSDGYDDMRAGAQVTVYDNEGKALALGSLGPGTSTEDYDCAFEFTVEDVPAGLPLYSVEVTHRGQFKFAQEDAELVGGVGGLELSLG